MVYFIIPAAKFRLSGEISGMETDAVCVQTLKPPHDRNVQSQLWSCRPLQETITTVCCCICVWGCILQRGSHISCAVQKCCQVLLAWAHQSWSKRQRQLVPWMNHSLFQFILIKKNAAFYFCPGLKWNLQSRMHLLRDNDIFIGNVYSFFVHFKKACPLLM